MSRIFDNQEERIAALEAERDELSRALVRLARVAGDGKWMAVDRKAMEIELNAIVSALWDLDNANAPVYPGDCRELARVIGDCVGRARALLNESKPK